MHDAEAAVRLERVRANAGLGTTAEPLRLESYSNDAWLFEDGPRGAVVLRVGWQGDITRLQREATILARLPSDVPRPELLDHGRIEAHGQPLAYTVTRRLPGRTLADAWPDMSEAQRRQAVARLADALRELHAWQPSETARRELEAHGPAPVDLAEPASVVGTAMNPLPLDRARALLRHAAPLPWIDTGLLAAVAEQMEALGGIAPVVDDPAVPGLVHGDLHTSNLWWSGDDLSALLDFEWARFGPAHLELERLADAADLDLREGIAPAPGPYVLSELIQHYPELVDVDRLPERLRLYSLAQAVRQLLAWPPPDAPEAGLPEDHPLRRLRRLVDGGWPTPDAFPACLMAR